MVSLITALNFTMIMPPLHSSHWFITRLAPSAGWF